MSMAHVDTSVLTAIAFQEPGASDCADRLARFDGLFFATLDARQAAVARALGFPLPWEAVAP